MASLSTLPWLAISKLIVDFIMNELELFYAPPVWIGVITSKNMAYCIRYYLMAPFRIKAKLQSGELAVAGDQWPIFLYHGYNYDSDDPWNGLFRSSILISVGSSCIFLTAR